MKTYEQEDTGTEGIKDCKQRIDFKDKRCEAASAVKNYKACNSLTGRYVGGLYTCFM